MNKKAISHVIGFDDAPFSHRKNNNVLIVGAVYAGERLDGVLSNQVRRDGVNSTDKIIATVVESRFFPQLQAVLLQGIAVAGFNVIDIEKLHEKLRLPVIVVSRKKPNLKKIKNALLNNVPGGRKKWLLIEKAGPMEAVGDVYVQRAGIDLENTKTLLSRFAINSVVPEPLRTAHLIAGGLVTGESRHRV